MMYHVSLLPLRGINRRSAALCECVLFLSSEDWLAGPDDFIVEAATVVLFSSRPSGACVRGVRIGGVVLIARTVTVHLLAGNDQLHHY